LTTKLAVGQAVQETWFPVTGVG